MYAPLEWDEDIDRVNRKHGLTTIRLTMVESSV